MRASAWMVVLGSASIAFSTLCGCSWVQIFPPGTPTLPNAVAVDRALRLCSLSEGDQPFHLILEISPPPGNAAARDLDASAFLHRTSSPRGPNWTQPGTRSPESLSPDSRLEDMHAEIEIFWLNPITYRTVIQSPQFSQTRIVNGSIIEEQDSGDYYPRWIQHFLDGLLNPVPQADRLRKVPGAIPIGTQSQACISNPGGSATETVQLCFRDAQPHVAGSTSFTRSMWFDDFAPFGSQQIARTLVDDLSANLLVRGHIRLLEPLQPSLYPLLRATHLTPPDQQLSTTLVSSDAAQALLESPAATYPGSLFEHPGPQPANTQPASLTRSTPAEALQFASAPSTSQLPIYIRTDRTGRVREAYRDPSDQYGLQSAALFRALTLHFKPLIVDGAPRQMEAPLFLPRNSPTQP